MNRTSLSITAEQGESNGFMTTKWYIDDDLILTTPDQNSAKQIEIHLDIDLPCRIKIICSGKNCETDTELVDGKIINDKYFCLTSVVLGKYPVNIGVLYHDLIVFQADGQPEKNTPYFHDNGIAIIDFREQDALLWHLKHNHFYQW